MAEHDFWQSILDYCSDSQSAIPSLESDPRSSDLIDIAPLMEELNVVDDIFTSKELLGGNDPISNFCESTDIENDPCENREVMSNPPEWDICNWSSIPVMNPISPEEEHKFVSDPDGNPSLVISDIPNSWNDKFLQMKISSPHRVPGNVTFDSLTTPFHHLSGTLSGPSSCSNIIDGDATPEVEEEYQLDWYSCSTQEFPDHNFIPSGIAELQMNMEINQCTPNNNAIVIKDIDNCKKLGICISEHSGNHLEISQNSFMIATTDGEGGLGDSVISSSDESINACATPHSSHNNSYYSIPIAASSGAETIYDRSNGNPNPSLTVMNHSNYSTRSWNRTASNKTIDSGGDQRGSHQRGFTDRITDITMNELSQYFNMPITQAAKELKVGLTVLKKRCREFGISRWPHRKMKSLDSLINNIQELGKSNGGLSNARLKNTVQILKEQKKLMEEMPGIELAERTKRLRQACFKASYKKRRQMAIENASPSAPTTATAPSQV